MYTIVCDHVAGSFMLYSLARTVHWVKNDDSQHPLCRCCHKFSSASGWFTLFLRLISMIELTPCPEGWPDGTTFTDEYSCVGDENYFACGAVELAKKLVGEWLYCHRTKIAVRILETEAYPEDEVDVYSMIFVVRRAFKIKAGQILACNRDGSRVRDGTKSTSMHQVYLYITAGAEDSGDVVLLRSCCPVQGHHLIEENCGVHTDWSLKSKINILVNPFKVSQGLNNEWEENPFLYQASGLQLYESNHPQDKVLLIGTRQLPNGTPRGLGLRNYRFALETSLPAYYYYMKGKALTLREVVCPPPRREPAVAFPEDVWDWPETAS